MVDREVKGLLTDWLYEKVIAEVSLFIFLRLSAILCCAPGIISAQQYNNVVHPKPADFIVARDSIFVFGNFSDPATEVFVNGNQAITFPNQTFLAMIPVAPGSLAVHTLFQTPEESFSDSRQVFVPPYIFATPAETIAFDTTFFYPDRNISIKSGDRIAVIVKGTPGGNVYCSLDEETIFKLKEVNHRRRYRWRNTVFGFDNPWQLPRVKGVYVGFFTATDEHRGRAFSPFFTLITRDEQVRTFRGRGTIHVMKNSGANIKKVIQDVTIFKNSRNQTFLTALQKDVLVNDNGGYGDYSRVRLDKKQILWIPRRKLQTAIENLHVEEIPLSRLQINRATSDSATISIEFLSDSIVPFQIHQSTNLKSFILKFWHIQKMPAILRNDYIDPLFHKISGKMFAETGYQFNLNFTHKMVWGFDISAEGNKIITRFYKSPVPAFDRSKPLLGIKICLDPGHGPDDGAFGLTGINEKMITLPYAELLREMLESRGATVFLTRENESGPSLQQRKLFAEANGADLFISLHFNALPNGVNPLKVRGTSTYYYHPHSKPLALAVHRRMLRQSQLPDKGVHLKNLAVCRITSMPSILLEPAFIMQPFEETQILDMQFREAVCKGIAQGIEDFIAKYH